MRTHYTFMLFFLPAILFARVSIDTTQTWQYLKKADSLYHLDDYNQSYQLAKKVESAFVTAQIDRHPHLARSYYLIGYHFEQEGAYRLALNYYKKRRDLTADLYGDDSPEMGRALLSMGNCYLYLDKPSIAVSYYLGALNIFHQVDPLPTEDLDMTYNNLGISYSYQSDYQMALSYFRKSLELSLENTGEKSLATAQNYNNLANSYRGLRRFNEAISYFQKAIRIKNQILNPDHYSFGISYGALGHCYLEEDSVDLALDFFRRRHKIFLNHFGKDHPFVANSYQLLGNALAKKGDLEDAFSHYYTSIKILIKHPDHQLDQATTLAKMGKVEMMRNKESQARIYYNRALEKLSPQKDLESLLLESAVPSQLIEVLLGYANCLFQIGLVNDDISILRQAAQVFEYTVQGVEHVSFKNKDVDSKQVLFREYYPAFEAAIEVNKRLWEKTDSNYYFTKAFNYAERSKSAFLLEAIKEWEARASAILPDSLIDQEFKLRVKIRGLQAGRFKEREKGKAADPIKIKEISQRIFHLQRHHEKLLSHLSAINPLYYKIKYDRRELILSEIQNQFLTRQQSLIEFFVGEDALYIFIIDRENKWIEKITLDFPLQETVQSLYNFISSSPESDQLDRYVSVAHNLYRKLILPIQQHLQQKLIIIPDGLLSYLPFEVLLSEVPEQIGNLRTYPFLLRHYQISYSFSGHLLRSTRRTVRPDRRFDLVAFAPQYHGQEDKSALSSLNNNKEEVKKITAILPGKLFMEQDASLDNFSRNMDQCQVLHLAAHGKSNHQKGEYSYLAFTPSSDTTSKHLLYVSDLYNMDIPAKMVVLSACETAIGELQHGEGVMSLARGFFYSGAESVITTLWNVSDRKAAHLMPLFYNQIKRGLEKDHALQMSKLHYIENSRNLEAHPFYWASFIAIGDMSSFDFKHQEWTWTFLLGALFMGLGLYFWKQLSTRKNG